MFEVRITHRTDGQEKVIEISDKDVASAFAAMAPLSEAITRFTDNGDGTITDGITGLMWSKDNVGIGVLHLAAAMKACEESRLAGHDDWRTPTRAELLTLVDDTRCDPAIDTTAFPSCKGGWYWSSTGYAGNSSCAWIVHFYNGNCNYDFRSGEAFVRAVRRVPAGQ